MKLGVGIIGYGHIAKKHEQVIAESPNFQLLKTSTQFSVQSILADSQVDIVVVSNPSGVHAKTVVEALNAQKHVLVEKPMALKSADCEEMIIAAEKAQKKLFVVKQNRFNLPIKDLKVALERGLFGKVFQLEVNGFWNRNEAYYKNSNWRGTKALDGGILFNQFSHFIDILYFLFGEINPIKAKLANYNHPYIEFEDTVNAIFETASGAQGALNCSTNATNQNMEGSLTVFAEKATIKIGGKYLNKIEYLQLGKSIEKEIQQLNLFESDTEEVPNNHFAVYESVFKALNGEEDKTLASAKEGKAVVEIIEKFYAAQ